MHCLINFLVHDCHSPAILLSVGSNLGLHHRAMKPHNEWEGHTLFTPFAWVSTG